MGKQMLSVGNAIAAGMMLSASYSLVSEGATVTEPEGMFGEGMGMLSAPWARVVVGVLAGLVFILSTKQVSFFFFFLSRNVILRTMVGRVLPLFLFFCTSMIPGTGLMKAFMYFLFSGSAVTA